METITIPSPSAFLSSPVVQPAPDPPPPPKRKPTTTTKTAAGGKKPAGIVKPKQSKSRNGCITCKAKRLKCDETKPSCQQCHKRNVTCGGYKKDFKWRPFEETTISNKVAPPRPKRSPVAPVLPPDVSVTSPASEGSSSAPGGEEEAPMHDNFFHAAPTPSGGFSRTGFSPNDSFSDFQFGNSPMFDMNTPPYMRELPKPRFEPDSVTKSLSSLFEDPNPPPATSRPSFSGQSPRLIDLLLPGSQLNAPPGTVPPFTMSNPALTSPSMDQQFLPLHDSQLEDDVEEVIRSPQLQNQDMWLSLSPLPFASSSTSPTIQLADPFNKIYRQPEVQAGSPEMLMLRFDKQTCGILSVKDGPTENPWRTLVWPLARDSPALYHAIASMTAFHTSREKPALRVDGMEHMRRSIRSLASSIETMRPDTALATTLVLAFSESWDQHISTGIEHLRGAKILVNQALIQHQKRPIVGEELARLKFLCNTFIYMDVIARLTSIDDDSPDDFSHVMAPFNFASDGETEIDPLMGCASSLFPLIGKVANLCRKVRKTNSNSIAVIGQAMELKEQIVQWTPPALSTISRPEDPTSEIQHALQTAEAYRYATLLYLHQAVPEIPSWTSAELAKKVLVFLATVPLSSRLVIVQIYPLLAAGCEFSDPEDRKWIEDRWVMMSRRMWIGNIDRCWEVMQEVWRRRDYAEQAKTEQESRKGRGSMSMSQDENAKRKFEEELARESNEEEFDFEGLVNAHVNKRQRKSFSNGNSMSGNAFGGQSGMGMGVGMGMGQMERERKRVHEPPEAEAEMDRELTVRGSLHWVGVMKDWEWEKTISYPNALSS